eukprot:TRINITY_DN20228_c0_g1_i1.p1 TRINITY_DN20228_c0_g1~~TRINITY_DN20228_c0_g1_i1.p1  ORF type:complete len:676 (-),score=101.83 TRINITY_DN20228_c0_g1_i1:486-2513(-)
MCDHAVREQRATAARPQSARCTGRPRSACSWAACSALERRLQKAEHMQQALNAQRESRAEEQQQTPPLMCGLSSPQQVLNLWQRATTTLQSTTPRLRGSRPASGSSSQAGNTQTAARQQAPRGGGGDPARLAKLQQVPQRAAETPLPAEATFRPQVGLPWGPHNEHLASLAKEMVTHQLGKMPNATADRTRCPHQHLDQYYCIVCDGIMCDSCAQQTCQEAEARWHRLHQAEQAARLRKAGLITDWMAQAITRCSEDSFDRLYEAPTIPIARLKKRQKTPPTSRAAGAHDRGTDNVALVRLAKPKQAKVFPEIPYLPNMKQFPRWEQLRDRVFRHKPIVESHTPTPSRVTTTLCLDAVSGRSGSKIGLDAGLGLHGSLHCLEEASSIASELPRINNCSACSTADAPERFAECVYCAELLCVACMQKGCKAMMEKWADMSDDERADLCVLACRESAEQPGPKQLQLQEWQARVVVRSLNHYSERLCPEPPAFNFTRSRKSRKTQGIWVDSNGELKRHWAGTGGRSGQIPDPPSVAALKEQLKIMKIRRQFVALSNNTRRRRGGMSPPAYRSRRESYNRSRSSSVSTQRRRSSAGSRKGAWSRQGSGNPSRARRKSSASASEQEQTAPEATDEVVPHEQDVSEAEKQGDAEEDFGSSCASGSPCVEEDLAEDVEQHT